MNTETQLVTSQLVREKQLSLDGSAEWNWSDDEYVTFTSDALGFTRFRIPNNFAKDYLTAFHVRSWRFAIGVERGRQEIWEFSLDRGRISEVACLRGRDQLDFGFQFVKAVANRQGMALIYERGVLFFDPSGNLVWRQDDLKLDHYFQGLDEEGVIYASGRGEKWRFSIENGHRSQFENKC